MSLMCTRLLIAMQGHAIGVRGSKISPAECYVIYWCFYDEMLACFVSDYATRALFIVHSVKRLSPPATRTFIPTVLAFRHPITLS